MEIKMPIKFHGNYVVSISSGDSEDRERCQKLTIRALAAEEQAHAYKGIDKNDMPSHQITFYDFGCKRIVEGKLIENNEERVVFRVKDKEYGFSPFKPKS
jgi:hypothetical protein